MQSARIASGSTLFDAAPKPRNSTNKYSVVVDGGMKTVTRKMDPWTTHVTVSIFLLPKRLEALTMIGMEQTTATKQMPTAKVKTRIKFSTCSANLCRGAWGAQVSRRYLRWCASVVRVH